MHFAGIDYVKSYVKKSNFEDQRSTAYTHNVDIPVLERLIVRVKGSPEKSGKTWRDPLIFKAPGRVIERISRQKLPILINTANFVPTKTTYVIGL